MKALVLLLIKIFSFAKFGKVLFTLGTTVLSIGSYTMIYGWRYAVGFVGLILVHEMGHYFAARRKKLNTGLPIFIPFVGAYIQLKDDPVNAEDEAYIAFAGPLVGSLAAFALYYWGHFIDSRLCLALAEAGFLINLFNLIPLHPLDGGRITAIISPRLWFLGVPLLIVVWIYHPSPLLILLAILAVPQLIKAWKFNSKAPENEDYYDISIIVRFEYAIVYLLLTVILGLMVGWDH